MVRGERAFTELGLVEREFEIEQIEIATQSALTSTGRLVVVEAAAGLGKSSLLASAAVQARDHGLSVLGARGSELEQEFAFGIVRQLFEPHVRSAGKAQRERLFAGAAALARPLFEAAHDAPAPTTADLTYATLHGLYWLLANLTDGGAVALTVDDAHWADGASLRFVTFLMARLEELPVALYVALRPGDPGADRPLLTGIVATPAALRLRPRPLSHEATARLIAAALEEEPDPGFTFACHAATAGNPFFLHALLAELAATDTEPNEGRAERVSLIGPRAVSRSVLLRLSALSADAPALALAAAVLGDGAALHEAAELAQIPVGRAVEIADLLSGAAVLKRSPRLEFVHPIVREAVYADLGPHQRASQHARAARILADARARPERIAAQLLQTASAADPWAVDRLREAARDALRNGASEIAVRYLRRALDEPPGPALRPRLLLELGTAGAAAGEPDALGWLKDALELAQQPEVRAGAAFELGRVLLYLARPTEAVDVIESALGGLGDAGAELTEPLEALLLMQTQSTLHARARIIDRLRDRMRDPASAPPAVQATIAVELAQSSGRAADGALLAARVLEQGRLLELLSAESPAIYFATTALALGDRDELAEQHLDRAVAGAREAGSVRGFAFASCFRAWTRSRRGDLTGAEADLDAFLGLAQEFSLDIVLPFGLGVLVCVRLERGGTDAAAKILDEADVARFDPDSTLFQELRVARARLRLAQSLPRQALDDALAVGSWAHAWGARDDAWTRWRPVAALAHAALDEHDEARRLAAESADLARESGAREHLGISLRTAGLVAAPGDGIALLEEAVGVLERPQPCLEHARALIDLGAALRRRARRTEARTKLQAGIEIACACGATTLADGAVMELRAAGTRPRGVPRTDALTPSELRVARMAAEGRSNPEIAQALFVSLKTVETHLGHAYQKLDVHSRSALPQLLALPAPERRTRV